MFFKILDNRLQEICATYVDDALHAGSRVYEGITEKTMKRFKCRDKEMDNVTFAASKLTRAPTAFNFINSGTLPHLKH
jgi:hypothetical protein